MHNRAIVFRSFLLALLFVAAETNAYATFVDATNIAGVDYIQHTTWTTGNCLVSPNFCEPERMSGGAAVGDYDRDGWVDLFVTRLDDTDILYRNLGDGTFLDVTVAAGITLNAHTNHPQWFDADNDGDLDLLLTTIGEFRNYLYINQGDGTFQEEGIERGVAVNNGEKHRSYTAASGDFDGDGYIDLFVSEWAAYSPSHAALLRNRGAAMPGHFTNVTKTAGLVMGQLLQTGNRVLYGFGPTFTDLDRDGHLDLAIASDFSTTQLFWNNGDGTFIDGTIPAMVGTDKNGMGSTFGDYDGDGDLDWFVTAIYGGPERLFPDVPLADRGNRLYRYEGNRVFSDATDEAGVRDGKWGWGTVFFDYDNDGDQDLIMTNGVRFPALEGELEEYDLDPMRLWENDGAGNMSEVSEEKGVLDTASGKGLLTFDYDQDGDLDVFCVNNGEGPTLYRNETGNENDWLRVQFTGNPSPTEGLNAFITLTVEQGGPAQVREHGVSSHFLGQSERVSHFGLGAPSEVPVHEVRVQWPRTGTEQIFSDVPRNQLFTITIPERESVYPLDFTCHDADYQNCDFVISLSELIRLIQFFNSDGYHIDATTEDGFAPGSGNVAGPSHHSDFKQKDWRIDLSELLRAIQFFNAGGFSANAIGEDGFIPLVAE